MSDDSDREWWSERPSDHDRPGDAAELADAADALRDAADALRDTATPSAPPEEGNWDFSYMRDWIKYTDNGTAFKYAAFSVGPLWTIFLGAQGFSFATAVGASLLGFIIVGNWHLRAERKATRLITWGFPLGLAYYAPIAIVFGLAEVLVGG
ncbi:hypothetical protein [Streptomyces jumonjinensis]|uniref:hypothetical protein n=1 Tax=Streptomyces jumonjinensis TaxID=1945 RepID=UPI00379736C6